jgi:hypothetical protein
LRARTVIAGRPGGTDLQFVAERLLDIDDHVLQCVELDPGFLCVCDPAPCENLGDQGFGMPEVDLPDVLIQPFVHEFFGKFLHA